MNFLQQKHSRMLAETWRTTRAVGLKGQHKRKTKDKQNDKKKDKKVLPLLGGTPGDADAYKLTKET